MRFATYVMCATFAGLCGYLFSAFSGGASLNMGEDYLLASIAVVVIGGTSVAGGFANVPGLWGAALFLFLLVAMLNTYGFGAGIRLVLTGRHHHRRHRRGGRAEGPAVSTHRHPIARPPAPMPSCPGRKHREESGNEADADQGCPCHAA